MIPAWGTPAWGAPRRVAVDSAETQARQLFRQAEVHFGLREFDRALELYSEAYRLKPLPGFLFNIAQCHRFSERHEDAAFSYRMYLQRAPEAGNRAEVEDLVRQMEAAAQRKTPDEPVAPRPGTEFVLPPPAPAPAVTAPAPVAPSSSDEPRSQLSPWVWGVGGVGVALLATGLVTGQMASDRSERLLANPDAPDSEQDDLRESGRALVVTSVATLSVGAAALLGAGALWFWGGSRSAEGSQSGTRSHIAWTATPIPSGFSMAWAGAF